MEVVEEEKVEGVVVVVVEGLVVVVVVEEEEQQREVAQRWSARSPRACGHYPDLGRRCSAVSVRGYG